MQIGIPRAMSYYNFFPFWFGFFEDLGIKVVLSDKTTKETMSKGSALVVTETCLPVKVYVGHVLNLLEKFMDVAELADETATKLIFRGSLGALFPEKKPEEEGDKE